MVPLDPSRAVVDRLGLPEGPGLLALRHALSFGSPGLWADAPDLPRSVLLIREGDGRLEAFGAGRPGPAVAWLAGQRRAFTLHAPEGWGEAIRERFGTADDDHVETWICQRSTWKAPAIARRLTPDDRAAFEALAPPWALRGWRSYRGLIEHAAAFGVPDGPGFAALAWVFDRAGPFDALGMFTAPRYRRLGLGRAAGSAQGGWIIDGGRSPLWSLHPGNDASRALAAALGFAPAASEPLWRWPPRKGSP